MVSHIHKAFLWFLLVILKIKKKTQKHLKKKEMASHDQNPLDEDVNTQQVHVDNVGNVVNQCISTLEETLALLTAQMQSLIDLQSKDKGKAVMPQHGVVPPLFEEAGPSSGVARGPKWQLKDLKPPKYNGTLASRTADAVEQWFSKWEHCFRLCEIDLDEAKIQHAMYNLLDVLWMSLTALCGEPHTWEECKRAFWKYLFS